ncbi:phage tail protein [Paracoccus bogoriensis]|uniref:phage tail protein n=1 Tax=Paracoccus bogoriensis TaxID=242065 RepID=UPI001CA521C0|nr:phage tail protein [Paracoccus bogoriensis]MBW7057317.1 phage tail protein [Paracoccus bogoriensis]
MRKLLLITTALVGIGCAAPAEAAPVAVWAATALGFTAGTTGFIIVSSLIQIGLSIGVSALLARAQGKPKQEAIRAELARPTSLPPYRFVYGETWAPGTPVAWTVVGRVLYICYLLNSRPSAGPFTVYFDKRAVTKTGDEFNFTGGGAAVSGPSSIAGSKAAGTYARYWIGRGDQTTCPAQIVAETNGYFLATDAWRGRTVLWARLDCGEDEQRQQRWPVTPPELNVAGRWSILRDPRDGQYRWSANQALVVLDALRNNPLRPYADDYLRLDTFRWAADVADQQVGRRDGGTIPRYRADGVLVFSDGSELEDQIQPLLDAGASELTRIGGRLGIVPAVARSPVRTITDFSDGQPAEFVRWQPSDEVYTEAVARYVAPDRAYESAETPAYVIPGAQAEDGGAPKRLIVDLPFVQDHRQAQRISKIMAMRSRMQRSIAAELMPEDFDLVAGSIASVQLGVPYGAWAGTYKVVGARPAAGIADQDSITIRIPAQLRQESAAIYAWSPSTEEKIVGEAGALPTIAAVQPPAAVTLTTGTAAASVSGDTVIPGVVVAWPGSTSASAASYLWEWQFRPAGGTWSTWRSGGTLDLSAADGVGVFSAVIQWPRIGDEYRARVRTVGTWGQSAWRQSGIITAAGPEAAVAVPPAPVAARISASRIDITATQADDSRARSLLIYGNSVDSPLTATLLFQPSVGASATITRSETGLTAGTTRFYWTRARDQWGNLSGFSASASATT